MSSSDPKRGGLVVVSHQRNESGGLVASRQRSELIKMVMLQVTSIALPAILTGPILGFLGFSAIGPVAGSMAAWFQSTFGTPIIFRIAQSAAMGGFGQHIVTAVVSVAGAVIAKVGAWAKAIFWKLFG